MIQYILECIAFQLVFLVIYDFFLKKETFFQWNRVYLIGTYTLSLMLPWIKIEAFKNVVLQQYYRYPEYLWGTNDASALVLAEGTSFTISIEYLLFFAGMFFAALVFAYKMLQLYRLRKRGEIHYFSDFTQIIIANSNLAFSFFKSIFLGDKVLDTKHDDIIQHELVHIGQRHSLDLLFFEIMRIVGWFNPLVYAYQGRISELHEFIADAQVAKTDKKEQYQLLLSQVFQTENISFVNQFFETSLIKKRIVMLQKSQSEKIWKVKYLLMFPLVMGMLFYTSCEVEEKDTYEIESTRLKGANEEHIDVPYAVVEEVPVFPGCEGEEDPRACFNRMIQKHIGKNFRYPEEAQEKGIQGRVSVLFVIMEDGSIQNIKMRGPDKLLEKEVERIIKKLPQMTAGKHKGKAVRVPFSIPITFKLEGGEGETINKHIDYSSNYDDNIDVPFATIDEVPVFPGCENAEDKRACFNKMIQKHIRKNFRYPEEAQEKGIQGRVSVLFVIMEDGSIQNIKMRGPDKLLEKEAERIIKKLSQMTAGKHKGKAVRVPFSMPITFKLQGEESDLDLLKLKSTNGLDPTFIVDGKEFFKKEAMQISPDDIGSISVFKGEAAIEKYGSNGKNGVVEITLKKKD